MHELTHVPGHASRLSRDGISAGNIPLAIQRTASKT
ncbi:hypothetical protein, partial [Klebsiella pneumoniae]